MHIAAPYIWRRLSNGCSAPFLDTVVDRLKPMLRILMDRKET